MNEVPGNIPDVTHYLNQGLAVALLIVGVWFAYRCASWIGINVVIPLRDAHVKYLGEQVEIAKQQAETAQHQGETMRIQTEILKGLQTDLAFIKIQVGRSQFEATS